MKCENALLCYYFVDNFRIQWFDPSHQNCRWNRGDNMGLENTKQLESSRKFLQLYKWRSPPLLGISNSKVLHRAKSFCAQNVKLSTYDALLYYTLQVFKKDSMITLKWWWCSRSTNVPILVVSMICIFYLVFLLLYELFSYSKRS